MPTQSLLAQRITVRAAGGVAVPIESAAEARNVGPAALVALEARLSPRWSVRLDGEWSLLNGSSVPAGQEPFSSEADLRIYGVALNAVARLSDASVAPYLLLGIGSYRLQRVGARDSPYGVTAAAQAGLGVNIGIWQKVNPFVEVRVQGHATDYAAGVSSGTIVLPVMLGVRVRQ